ncbi:condensin complex subunit Cut3 [Ceratobasidium sp. 428]|nr:condensin complex subunit Cut3 [Ceratobasidium sp. 428]
MNLSATLISKIPAIVVFGDPNLKSGDASSWPINSPSVDASPRDGSTLAQNIASFCNSGDQFCDPNGNVLPPHLRYGQDGSTMVAANFVKQKL